MTHLDSPFTPRPPCPTLNVLAVYYDHGVIRRLWVWPWQLTTSEDRWAGEPWGPARAWNGRIEANRGPRWT